MYSPTARDLAAAKKSVRLSSNNFDDEIKDTVLAALSDMEASGVATETQPVSMVMQAVKSYCRSFYDYNGQGETWRKIYIEQVKKLELSSVGDVDG